MSISLLRRGVLLGRLWHRTACSCPRDYDGDYHHYLCERDHYYNHNHNNHDYHHDAHYRYYGTQNHCHHNHYGANDHHYGGA